MDRKNNAKNNFLNGLNCTQAILLAFSDLLEVPEETLLALGLPMGGGMGRLRQTCGGVTGAVLCLGLLFPEYSKKEMYALVQEFADLRRKTAASTAASCLRGRTLLRTPRPSPRRARRNIIRNALAPS